jgi:DNA polymerase-3 subunit epsilon
MNFVTIDFETADYSRRSACSVGMVKYQDGKKIDAFYSLIRPPELYIRPNFTAIHGLTVEDVKGAPTFAELWKDKISNFIGDFPLAAHNANFDMGVLIASLEWYELEIPYLKYFCSLQLARHTWPSIKSHALAALAEEFGIAYKVHNALDDAETCGKIILMAAEKFHSTRPEELLKAANVQMMTKGQTLSQEEINQLLGAIGASTESEDCDFASSPDDFDNFTLDEDGDLDED